MTLGLDDVSVDLDRDSRRCPFGGLFRAKGPCPSASVSLNDSLPVRDSADRSEREEREGEEGGEKAVAANNCDNLLTCHRVAVELVAGRRSPVGEGGKGRRGGRMLGRTRSRFTTRRDRLA